jgi:hypothetical protein
VKIFENFLLSLQGRIDGLDGIDRVIRPLYIGCRDVTWLGSATTLDEVRL